MAVQADYISVVQQLYVSYFGRPADFYGLDNFTKQLATIDTAGALTTFQALSAAANAAPATSALGKLINSFSSSAEAAALYGTDTSTIGTSKFVAAVYQNILGREADVEGLKFWVDAIQSGNLTRANAAAAITEGALSNTSAQGLLDAKTVANKNEVAKNFTAAINTTAEINGYSGDAAATAARVLLQGVNDTTVVSAYQATVESVLSDIVVQAIPTVTTNLGTGIDTLPGSAGKDIINAIIDGANSTLNTLDTINGNGGSDVLNLDVLDGDAGTAGAQALAALPSVTVSNVETVNVRATVDLTANFSGWTGLTAANVTQAVGDVVVTGASTTALSVAGAEQDVTLKGGASQSVVTSGGAVTLGGATGNTAGAIAVTHSAQTSAINVDGGSTVTINATADANSGNIILGANKGATGVVVVNQNLSSDGTAITAGDVTVTGGSTVTINANLTNVAEDGGGTGAITAGTYTVTSGGSTTAVTIKQTAVATDFAGGTTGATKETAVVTFGALKAGEKVAISSGALTAFGTDLTFTAAKDLTAAEVAAAFAALTSADKQAPGGWVANGTFTGSLDAGWVSGAASAGKVTFTASATGAQTDLQVTTRNVADNAAALGSAAFGVVVTDGSAGTTVAAVDVTADYGNVVVDDAATKSVTTITLNGYSAAALGAGGSLDKLATLNLANGAGTTAVTSTSTTLAVALDGMKAASALTLGATVATLNITTSGAASDLDITAAGAKTVTIAAGANLKLSDAPLAAVEALTITGAGNVTLGDISGTVKSITAGAATGKISATVDGDVAVVTTGSGADSITVDTATISKAINLGAGDDTLILSAATASVPTAAVAGGAGEDTISMTSASAQALDGNTNFKSAISSFERLNISNTVDVTGGNVTIDLENLGFSYVTLAAGPSGAANALILDKMANNGTLALVAAPANAATVQVNVTDAATGTADKLNLSITADATVAAGTVTANNVETIAIKSTDTFVDGNADGADDNNAVHTLTLAADAVTSIVVTGDDLNLDTNSTVLTSVDASALLGGIVYTADGKTSGTTVLGGAGVDNLTSSGENDVLKGNAGKDIFTVKDLAQVYGGTGADTFNFLVNTNLTKVSTIRDAEALDVIVLKDVFGANALVTKFYGTGAEYNPNTTTDVAGKVNAALAQTGEGESSWFQHNGNTYIVIDANDANNVAAGAVDAYIEGQDIVIEIIGTWDLSKATFNSTYGTLELG